MAPAVAKATAALELAEQSAGAVGQLGELQAKVAADPKDFQSRFDLALALYASGEQEKAMDELLEIVQRNRPGTRRPRASSWSSSSRRWAPPIR